MNDLTTMPVEELQALLNGLLVDSWDAAQYLRLSPATLRDPKNKWHKHSVKIGQYNYWRRVDLEMASPRTIEFSYICNYDENGPVRRTDKITIQPYGERGWEWDNNDGTGFSGRTNEAGNGLWWLNGNDWQQQFGTGQFSLPRDACKCLYKLAKREAEFNSVGGEFDDLQVSYTAF